MSIVDPVCAQILGHNFTSIIKYREYFKSFDLYEDVVPVAFIPLLASVAESKPIQRSLEFYYHNRMKIEDESGKPIIDETSELPDYEKRQLALARANFLEFLEDFESGSDDALFFPLVDFYAAVGLFSAFKSLSEKSSNKFQMLVQAKFRRKRHNHSHFRPS